ncbi:MAG: AI-2E family transporter, partial [Chlorobiales bacterium]|nr:AI-2E family transporter [Chlorobiales bacterium]
LRENLYANRLLWVTAILFIVWFASALSGLLAPFIIGFVLAYLFEPVMTLLCRWKIPRALAALLITLFGVGGIALTIILIAPDVSDQLGALFLVAQTLPEKLQEIGKRLPQLKALSWLNIDLLEIQKKLIALVTSRVGDIGALTADIATTLAESIPKLISLITSIILIPFLSFYFLNDYEAIQKTINKLLPKTKADTIKKHMDLASGIFRQYLRGYLIIMLIDIVLYTLILSLIGISYPLLLGIISGLMLFIPYVGIIIAISLSAIVTLLGDNIGENLLWVGLTYASVHSLENFVLVPKIVGAKVKLNPILVFLSIFLFGYFFGLIGILISIPVSAYLVAVFTEKFLTKPMKEDTELKTAGTERPS